MTVWDELVGQSRAVETLQCRSMRARLLRTLKAQRLHVR